MLLRDPVERYRSGIALHLESMREPRPAAHPMAPANHVFRSLYDLQLRRMLAHFPRERLLVLQFEACLGDPGGELERTYRFLGLDPGHRPAALGATSTRRQPTSSRGPTRSSRPCSLTTRGRWGPGSPIDLSLWPTAAHSS